MLVLEIIHFILALIIVFLHGIGCYLLSYLYRNGRDSPHDMLLINLSVTEGTGTFLGLLVIRIPKLFSIKFSKSLAEGRKYLTIVLFTTFTFIYYMNMIYITIEKLLEIALNIKYPVYWNEIKTKWLLIATWVIGALLCVSIMLSTYFTGTVYDDKFFMYFYPTLDFVFVVVALSSYSYIFHRYKKTRQLPTQGANLGSRRSEIESTLGIFLHSRFYVSFLLIITFLLFVILPDLIYLIYGVIMNKRSEILDTSILILFDISFLSDACIYIFIQEPVRKLLWKRLRLDTFLSNILRIDSTKHRSETTRV